MPLPAAWNSLRNVGAAGRNGSDIAPRSNAEVHGSFRSRQSARRATGDPILHHIRCRHVWGLSKETGASPAGEPASCADSGQCSLSSRNHAETLPCGKAPDAIASVPSALQPRAQSRRAGMEAGEKAVYSQSILSTAQRSGRHGIGPVRSVEKTEQNATTLMRHYLSRSV